MNITVAYSRYNNCSTYFELPSNSPDAMYPTLAIHEPAIERMDHQGQLLITSKRGE
jgi:hypothetical protein